MATCISYSGGLSTWCGRAVDRSEFLYNDASYAVEQTPAKVHVKGLAVCEECAEAWRRSDPPPRFIRPR